MSTAIHHAPLGAGDLHQALEGAGQLTVLNSFCAALHCAHTDVSDDGLHIAMPRVFALMRKRGFDVADPVRAPLQPKPGFTGWLVHVRMPRAEFDIGFYTANPVPAAAPKRTRKTAVAHA